MSNTGSRRALILLLVVALAATPATADWWSDLSRWLRPLSGVGCGGFTIISATPIQVTSTNENLSGKYTTLYVVANCAGESAQLISRDQLSSLLQLPIGTDIEIGIASTEEVNTYPIFNEGVPVYTYTYTSADSGQPWTPSLGVSPTYKWHTSCQRDEGLWRERIGTLGSIGPPSSQASALLNLRVGSVSSQIKVSSTSMAEELLTPDGDSIGSVTWLGSLVTGQSLPSEANYGAFYDEAKKEWRVTTMAERLAYISKQAATEAAIASVPPGQAWIGGSGTGWSSYCYGAIYAPSGAISAAGLSSSAASAMRTSTAQLGTAPIYRATDMEKAAVPFSVVGKINNPTLLIRVRADLLNIKLPVGKPAITGAAFAKFGVGEIGFLKVGVQNVGDAQGAFIAEASCGSLQFAPTQAVTIQPGKSWEFALQTGATKEERGTCSVKVCDMSSRECAIGSAIYEVTPTKKCIPGEVKPELVQISLEGETFVGGAVPTLGGLLLTQCSADGMSTTVIKSCEAGTLVYEPSVRPYPWACSEVPACLSPLEIFEVRASTGEFVSAAKELRDPALFATSILTSYIFADPASGCTYYCQAIFGDGTSNPATGSRNNLLGCADVSKKVAEIKASIPPRSTQPSSYVPSPPAPPMQQNTTGASTAGQCKLDADCRYVGERCVTGACVVGKGGAIPGFEAVFAVAGLLVVAWLVKRRQAEGT